MGYKISIKVHPVNFEQSRFSTFMTRSNLYNLWEKNKYFMNFEVYHNTFDYFIGNMWEMALLENVIKKNEML